MNVGRRLRSRSLLVLASASLLLTVLTPVSAVPAAASTPTVSYTYDAAGRLSTVTDTAGETATYHYDAEGNVLSITYGSGGTPAATAPKAHAAPPPSITSVHPTTVRTGGSITVTGTGFAVRTADDVVRIGRLFAHVTGASTNRLTLAAPPGSGGRLTVQTPSGIASGSKVSISEPRQPRPPAQGRNLHPLRAPTGVTAISGLVENAAGKPLSGVRLTITPADTQTVQARTITNARGLFLLAHLPAGSHQLIIDGNSVTGGTKYGFYAEPVQLPAGRTTVLPWITYLTALDRSVSIASPTTRQVTVTNPRLPGLKIVIPKGTVIHDYAGHVVTAVSLTPLTVGRTPFPWAPNMVPQYFSLQPGDATVSGAGLKVIYPNASNQPPGAKVPYLVESPDWPGTGWWQYGTGTVTANGRAVIPDRGTVYRKILPGGYGTGDDPCFLIIFCLTPGQPPRGEPVDLGTGMYLYQAADLDLPDVEGVTLTRSYRQDDNDIYDFGRGMSDSLNMFINADNDGNFDLYLPDSAQVEYVPTGTTGVYDAVETPTDYAGSVLSWTNTDPDGPFSIELKNGTTLSFSNPAFLTKITDRFGNSITINRTEYVPVSNGGGQIQSVTTSDGRWLKFTYGTCIAGSNPSYCVTQVQDNSGRTLSYAYDANGRLTSVTDPAGKQTRYTWAACTSDITCTEMLSVKDPDGSTVLTNSYDPTTGRVATQTQADSGVWSYSYQTNGSGQVTQTDWTNPVGTQYSQTFGSNGYPTSETDGVGLSSAQTTSFAYDPPSNQLDSETDALGRTTSFGYDALGNLTGLTFLSGTAKAASYAFTYDPTYNRLTSVTDPLHHQTSIAYADSARTETITDALGHQTVLTANAEGQPVSVADPAGDTTHLSYLNGNLVSVADPLGQVTSTYYSSIGQPLQTTDPEGNVTTYTWTPLDEQASQTDPLGDANTFGYDADGNLTSVTDANSNTTTFGYDPMGDLIKQQDPLGNVDTYSYDHIGDLLKHTDANGTVTSYRYLPLDLLSEVRYGVSGSTAQSSVRYFYDPGNRLTREVDSASGTFSNTYDGLNDLLSATAPQGKLTYTYNLDGYRTSMSVPGQAKVTYRYDADNELTGLTQGATHVTASYDAAGRRKSLLLPDGINQTTTYNADSQPSAISYADGSTQVGALGYTYTPDELIATVSGSLAAVNLPPMVTAAAYNADNEIENFNGTSFSYDSDGNLLSDGTSSYGWNDRGELASVTGPTDATYAYDPNGRQVSSTMNSATASYLYDGNNLVQQQSGGTASANFLGDGLGETLAMSPSSGATSSFLTDALGSTVGLANPSGHVTTSYTYDPNGAAQVSGAASANPIQFAGAQTDGAGQYLLGVRSYDPGTGAFLSRDPAGFDSGPSNLYGYVDQDPVNFVDPSGLAAARARKRPARIAHGKGTQPTPELIVFSVGASPAGPAPDPGGGAGQGSGAGGTTRQSGGGGGGGGCLTISAFFFLGGTYSQCTETINNQTYETSTWSFGVGTPGLSGEASVNSTNATDPNQLGGAAATCSLGAGDGVEGSVSASTGTSATTVSAGEGYGVGTPVSANCTLGWTTVSPEN